jgi:hypothetical protein
MNATLTCFTRKEWFNEVTHETNVQMAATNNEYYAGRIDHQRWRRDMDAHKRQLANFATRHMYR